MTLYKNRSHEGRKPVERLKNFVEQELQQPEIAYRRDPSELDCANRTVILVAI